MKSADIGEIRSPVNPMEVGRLLEIILSSRKLCFNAQVLSCLINGLELIIPETDIQMSFRAVAIELKTEFTEENINNRIETYQNGILNIDECQALSK